MIVTQVCEVAPGFMCGNSPPEALSTLPSALLAAHDHSARKVLIDRRHRQRVGTSQDA